MAGSPAFTPRPHQRHGHTVPGSTPHKAPTSSSTGPHALLEASRRSWVCRRRPLPRTLMTVPCIRSWLRSKTSPSMRTRPHGLCAPPRLDRALLQGRGSLAGKAEQGGRRGHRGGCDRSVGQFSKQKSLLKGLIGNPDTGKGTAGYENKVSPLFRTHDCLFFMDVPSLPLCQSRGACCFR